MSERLPVTNDGRLKNPKTKELLKTMILVILAGLITFGLYRYWHKKSNTVVYKPSSINQLQKDLSPTATSALENKDYTQYQQSQALVAGEFIVAKNYASAKQVLDGILSNVPQAQVNPVTYSTYISLARAQGDKATMKKYEKLIIPLLMKDGETKEAQAYQKELDTL